MANKKTCTDFLNVDLDISGEADDLEMFLKLSESSVVVLNQTSQFASLELAQESVPSKRQ